MLDRRRVRGVIATLLFSMALLAAGSPVACRRGKASTHTGVESSSRSEATAYVASIESAELLVEAALANFRAHRGLAPAERRAAAERVLAAARSAREDLESLRVPAAFEAAHREELVFLNHVLPAFSDYLANHEGGNAIRDLDGVLQRGRAHQERAAQARTAAGLERD